MAGFHMDFTAMPQAADFLKTPTLIGISILDFLFPLLGFALIMVRIFL